MRACRPLYTCAAGARSARYFLPRSLSNSVGFFAAARSFSSSVPVCIVASDGAPFAIKNTSKQALFVTRGDKSGTHVAEMELWEKAGVKPAGSWYHVYEKGSLGNAPTLKFTDEKGAYTVIDRATVLANAKEIKLAILVEKDEALLNFISLIPVNPGKFPRVNNEDAMVFVKWLTAPDKGQAIIRDFGKEKYGAPMFFPDSKEWNAGQKK